MNSLKKDSLAGASTDASASTLSLPDAQDAAKLVLTILPAPTQIPTAEFFNLPFFALSKLYEAVNVYGVAKVP